MNFFDKLPRDLPFLKKPEKAEFYFALHIGEAEVVASIWGINGNRLELISSSFAPIAGDGELVDAANLALDQALGDFQPEPEKVLFGVPDSWLQDENLKEEYLKILRHLVKELDITPLAYVSSTHAIVNFLQKQHGVPPTAILVSIANPLVVSVVKAGKVLATKTQKRTDSLAQDLEKALLTFTSVEVLPSKFVLYGGQNLESLEEELVSYPWMSQLPFLHLPKVEVLDHDVEIKAVCLAGASEINPDVVYHNQELQTEKANPHKNITHKTNLENAGFVAGDITEDENIIEPELEDDFETPASPRRGVTTQSYPAAGAVGQILALLQAPLDKIRSFGKGSSPASPSVKGGVINPWRRKQVLVPVVIFALLLLSYLFLFKAKATVFIDMEVLERESQVTADPRASEVNEDSKIIPGEVVESQVSGTGTGKATGTKKEGESAKGRVIVYNKTNSPRTFSAGTVLIGPNNIKFTLDTSVNVASQSSSPGADFVTVIQPGKSDVVGSTASDIGPEGNIAAGTELAINGSSKDQYVARVDTAFSGGVSRDVTVVTADDQKRLLATLTSELRSKAQEEIQGKLDADMKILQESLTDAVVKSSYSKGVGDKASEFTLNLTTNFRGTAYYENDLKLMVSKLVSTNVPEGFELKLENTETQAEVSKVEDNGKIIFLAKFKARLMPKLDTDKIKQSLIFKTPQDADIEVRKIDNVIGTNFEFTPPLPSFLQRLPLLPQNIDLEVTAK